VPVVVTGYGAALDFCGPDTAYLIPAHEVRKPKKRVGDLETVDYPWQAEVDVQALISLMQHVYRHRLEAKALGARLAPTFATLLRGSMQRR